MYTQSNPKDIIDLDQDIQYYREAIGSDSKDGPGSALCSSLASAIYIRCQDAIAHYQNTLLTCPIDPFSELEPSRVGRYGRSSQILK